MAEYPCRSCDQVFADYHALALHVVSSKKGHQKGKKWAQSFLLKAQFLNSKKDTPERSPMNEDEKVAVKEAKLETRRELSGELVLTMTVCPKCKTASRQVLPKEYVESPHAWRTGSGALMIVCMGCRR